MKTRKNKFISRGRTLNKRFSLLLAVSLLTLPFFAGNCPEPVTETPLTITKLTINDNSVDLTNPQTQTNVPLSPTIVATFSHTVTSAELGNKLTLGPETSGDNIGISITAGNNKSFTIALAAGVSLSQNTAYILTFKKGLAATIDGVTYSLAQDVSVKFTTQNTHTITFDAKGGSEVAAITLGDGETLTLPANPARENYGFGGWFKDEALTQAFSATETISADLTLYAKWTIVTYTVTFDSKSGSAVEAKTVNHGDKLTLPTAPTRSGYILEGWYKDNDLTMVFDEKTETITADVTLYAKWTDFTISEEYIDFHSWYGEITWNGSETLNPALLIISTSATPKAWDGTSTLDGNGKLTAAGITGVDVAAIYSRKFTSADSLKTRKVYMTVTDAYTSTSITTLRGVLGEGVNHYVVSTADKYNNIPWLMKANTQYYLHIYAQGQVFTHAFRTPDYPSSTMAADDLFPGNSLDGFFSTGLSTGLGESQENALERKANEPAIANMPFYTNATVGDLISLFFQLLNKATDTRGPTIGQYVGASKTFTLGSTQEGIFISFEDHAITFSGKASENPNASGNKYGVVDVLYIDKKNEAVDIIMPQTLNNIRSTTKIQFLNIITE